MNENESSYFVFSVSLVGLGVVAFFAAAFRALPLASFALITLVVMLAMRVWGRVSLARVEISMRCDTEKLYAGDSFSVRARVVNQKALPLWFGLEVETPRAPEASSGIMVLADDARGEAVGNGGAQGDAQGGEGAQRDDLYYRGPGIEAVERAGIGSAGGEAGLLPFEELEGSWRFVARRRGVYALGPAHAHGGDLLGIFRSDRKLRDAWNIVVYPRRVALRFFDVPFRDYFGIHPSKGIIEDPAWYEGTREYVGNRPARTIHWKASARLGKLQEKIFEPTSHQKIFFLFEGLGFRRAEDRRGFERALEVLAALAGRFAESGASFGIATDCAVKGFPAILPVGRGPEHLGMLLEMLARCEFERGQSIAELIGTVGAAGAGFLVVARAPSESTERFFALPSARRNRVYFVFSRRSAEDEADGEVPSGEAVGEGAASRGARAGEPGDARSIEAENPSDALTDEASEKGLRYPAAFFDELVAPEEAPGLHDAPTSLEGAR